MFWKTNRFRSDLEIGEENLTLDCKSNTLLFEIKLQSGNLGLQSVDLTTELFK